METSSSVPMPTWEIALPPAWQKRGETETGELYFESEDGTKGMYIATWRIELEEGRSPVQVAQSFRKGALASLDAMAGYEWQLVADASENVGLATIAVTDAWTEDRSYRIACKVLVQLPLVVRAAFHDYLCEDLAASQAYFGPIIESLRPAAPLM